MIKAAKVRLRPTKAQEIQLRKSAGVARFAYNWSLARQKENYENGGKFLNDQALRKEFTQLKQVKEYKWLYETSNNISKQAIKDACNAYERFFKKQSGFPKFKSKRRSKPSFYNDNIKLKFIAERFLIEKVGWVRISESERITANRFYNPRISFDSKYWYISVGIEADPPTVELADETIGIDLGIKDLAVCSNGMKFENINNTTKTKKQAKRLRRLQRKVSRKYEKNKNGKEYVKTRNIIKLEKRIRACSMSRFRQIFEMIFRYARKRRQRILGESLLGGVDKAERKSSRKDA